MNIHTTIHRHIRINLIYTFQNDERLISPETSCPKFTFTNKSKNVCGNHHTQKKLRLTDSFDF